MADIKLGLYGAETTLPQVSAPLGAPPQQPVGRKKQVDEVTMLDGSSRFNSREFSPKTFSLPWSQLTAAQIATLQGIADLNVRLHYLNEWIDATWRWVMVLGFDFTPVVYLGTVLYDATMDLKQVED